ncbi:MAG: DUF58 domain-containing protein [Bacteroidota bacterium]
MIGHFVPAFGAIGDILALLLLVATIIDILILFMNQQGCTLVRNIPKRLSNGDENDIRLHLHSTYTVPISVEIVDEIPHQFQIRNFMLKSSLSPGSQKSITYSLRPVERGAYLFGQTNVFVQSPLRLVKRRYQFGNEEEVPVYPSFIQMRKFELYAFTNRLTEVGLKKIRRLGHTMEFDQIKEYVRGDDIRSINWKATARSNQMMVNQYQDEKSQPILNVIDMGRVMKLPFNRLSLLDYAINTSLVISNIALLKEDKAGLVTFSNDKSTVVKPERKRTHIRRIQESLYNLTTNFLESDFERLLIALRQHINQRSLLLLYTNFETFSAMERQLPYLQRIARDHLLVTVFFENTEMNSLLRVEPDTVGDIYTKTVAEQFAYEKEQIVRALNQRGIQTILTPPEELSINAINKYLELKARGLI